MEHTSVFHESRPAMGTDFDVWLEAVDATRAQELFAAAFADIE